MDNIVCDYCDIQSYKEKSFQHYICIYPTGNNHIIASYNLCIGELSVKKLKLKKKFLRKKIIETKRKSKEGCRRI